MQDDIAYHSKCSCKGELLQSVAVCICVGAQADATSDSAGMLPTAGPGSHDRDAASVRANTYTPPSQAIYYFEVTVVSSGHEGYIGVGMRPFLTPLPGKKCCRHCKTSYAAQAFARRTSTWTACPGGRHRAMGTMATTAMCSAATARGAASAPSSAPVRGPRRLACFRIALSARASLWRTADGPLLMLESCRINKWCAHTLVGCVTMTCR